MKQLKFILCRIFKRFPIWSQWKRAMFFTLPLILLVLYGLNSENNSMVYGQIAKQISDGTMGQYEAFPDLRKLANGDLLVVYYASEGHIGPSGKIIMRRSSDNGITWSNPQVIVDLPGNDRDPSLFQTSKGTILCNFMTFYSRDQDPAFVVRVIRSTDNGKTWSKPIDIESPFKKVTASSSPIIELKNGDLLLPVYGRETKNGHPSDKKGERDRAAFLRSTDDGQTWKDPIILESNNTEHHQEPSLLGVNDDTLLCMVRPKGGWSWSKDLGKSWSPVQYLNINVDCPYLFSVDDKTLLCGLRHRSAPLPISMLVSRDMGKTWSDPIPMANGAGAYPSIQQLTDNLYAFAYYRDDPGPSRIWMLYFQLNENGTVNRLKIDNAYKLLRTNQ